MKTKKSVLTLALFLAFYQPTATLAFVTPKKIRVLSLNTWLLPKFSKDYQKRKPLIPKWIASTGADIVALQEVWGNQQKRFIARELKKFGYTFSFFQTKAPKTESGSEKPESPLSHLPKSIFAFPLRVLFGGILLIDEVVGFVDYTDGLLIASKFPIDSDNIGTMTFKHSTQIEESFIRKGAIVAPIRLPGGDTLHVYNTHLGAQKYVPHLGGYHPEHSRKNQLQLAELHQWIQKHRNTSHPELIMGDFNFNYQEVRDGEWTEQADSRYALLTRSIDSGGLALTDCYQTTNGTNLPDGYTSGLYNHYRSDDIEIGEVLDYTFMSQHRRFQITYSEVTDPYVDLEPKGRLHLSDHKAVLSEIQFRPMPFALRQNTAEE